MKITIIIAYSGMKFVEICTLRNEDIQDVGGILCLRICAYHEDPCSPKTKAGDHLVFIHFTLLAWEPLFFISSSDISAL